jgi:hypothetical protein
MQMSTKSECPISQTELSDFGSSNFTASFVKIQNRLFNPPSMRHQGTFTSARHTVTTHAVHCTVPVGHCGWAISSCGPSHGNEAIGQFAAQYSSCLFYFSEINYSFKILEI